MWETEQSRRFRILTYIVVAVFVVLILRLGWLQLLNGASYKKIADENRIRQITAQAPRGTIYDRNGAVLIANRPSFAISIIPSEYSNSQEETPLLAELTGVEQAEIEKMLVSGKGFPYSPIRIKRDVDQTIIAKIQERREYLPGVMVEAIPVRHYVYNRLAAHTFGYVGRINEEEYGKWKEQGYNPNDLVGKDGLERIWEEVLRGEDGGLQVEVNAMGEELGLIGNKPAKPGKALVLTLDANLQKAAEDALEAQIAASRSMGEPAKGGAVVVVDVNTGGILTLASSPAFDPNVFAAGINTRDWYDIISNPNNVLNNRTIQSAYPPGSVFKIVTAAAALELNLTTPQEVFEDKGVYMLAGWRFYGWNTKGLGKLTVADGLAWSSDPVFYELGNRVGVDNLASFALTFGYGQLTGIKLLGETEGVVPTQEWKKQTYGMDWYPGETIIAAIGQGYYLATPLQQALLLATVANGGKLYRPMLVDKVITPDGALVEKYQPEVVRTVYLRPEVWDTIRQGLIAVTTRGTGATVFRGIRVPVAGKTGSSETGRGTTHSWFACYAPVDNPAIAIAVLIDEGGEGSVGAAPVVRKVVEAYFGVVNNQPLPTPPRGTTD